MRQHYLVFTSLPGGKGELLLTPEALPLPPFNSPYRISPIFPVLPDEVRLPDMQGPSFVGFYSFERAFSVIGRLLHVLPSDLLSNMWFSHGFASLIIFSKDRTALDFCREDLGLGWKGHEIWSLADGAVFDQQHWLPPLEPTELELVEVADFTSLDSDLQRVLLEFRHCIYTAIERGIRYAPDYVPSFLALTETVNQVIEELLYITGHSATYPRSCSGAFADHLRSTDVERQRRLNHRTDHIIQLNSALSYVVSQSFAGTIPILERECQIRSYSLLGVGGASIALFRLADFVQEVFRHHPVDEVLLRNYIHVEGVEVFTNLGDFRPSKWTGDKDLRVDSHFDNISPTRLRPKLVFYSGRLGFKESEFSVTAALQVISGAGSARWSLMTLTHELMHAHVRALFSVIFKDLEEKFEQFYDDFKLQYERPDPDRRWKLIESLRLIILNYLFQKKKFDTFSRQIKEARAGGVQIPGFPKLTFPGKEELGRWMREAFRDLHEIMVHVCDYYYFYNTNDPLYLGLLWESWATVPTVLAEIDHYVFRSIVAVATKESGAIHDRFQLALNILVQNLEIILTRRPGNPVIRAALDFARNKTNHLPMSVKFYPALYLAEAVSNFLVSRKIHVALMAYDENLEIANGGYRYQVDTGEFPGFDIKSPVGFLADRLRRSLEGESEDLGEEHVSAWLLLACASTTLR